MCGIVGYQSFIGNRYEKNLQEAVDQLNKRGPDVQNYEFYNGIGFGHSRLSIIDTSSDGNQPMTDKSGRYVLTFNGEIYNYKELKKELSTSQFNSSTDTEVLLYLLIEQGKSCLRKLNGFFAFAFYDKEEDYLLLARDRVGIKPLNYYYDDSFFAFASELKALLKLPVKRTINQDALYWYLRLNYVPDNLSMIQGVKKLSPGGLIEIKNKHISESKYWSLDENVATYNKSYSHAKEDLVNLLDESVKSRLIADVPLGAFLSGGIDSSIIVALASKHVQKLNTFSIGYKDNKFFDETYYADLVAKKFDCDHHVFSLSNNELLNELESIVNYIDEPFADASAIPTYILSKKTREHVTVALSGDGADELFAGYNKHTALNAVFFPTGKQKIINQVLKISHPLINILPKSRSNKLSDTIRKFEKFGRLLNINDNDQYLFLASFTHNADDYFINPNNHSSISAENQDIIDFNSILDMDISLVLPNDMLTKVDMMSMANSLEVRVPFLDKAVLSFARSLDSSFKLNGRNRKRILQDSFKNTLPKELYNRPKHGFDVPMLHWMKNELKSELDDQLFDFQKISDQGIFNPSTVQRLRQKLNSRNPEDSHETTWALYVFQRWYSKYFD